MQSNFVKIYGDKRVGTNYMKFVLEKNFHVVALMNILGWKHGKHPEKIDWSGDSWIDPRFKKNRKNFVKLRAQILKCVPEGLKRACRRGNLRYIVCVRHPIHSFVSHMKVLGYKEDYITKYIKRWNNVYSDWSNLVDSHKRAIFVRHEDMVGNFEHTMEIIRKALQLQVSGDAYVNTQTKLARKSDENWHQRKGPLSGKKYDARQTKKQYAKVVSPRVLRLMRAGLRQDLLTRFDYAIKTA